MMETSCPIKLVQGVPVIAASAEIDVCNGGILRAAILHTAAFGYATMVVDMSRTEFCDSAGLGVLVRAHKRALAEGGDLRLVVTTPAVLRILTLTGLDQALRLFTTVADAVAELPAVTIQPARDVARVADLVSRVISADLAR
jgi:anti-sigma B factor antagonist